MNTLNQLDYAPIQAERVRAIYSQATMTSLNSWATALLVIFIPNPVAAKSLIGLWFAALTLSCIFRLVLARVFLAKDGKGAVASNQFSGWGHLYAAAVFFTALVWSLSLFVLGSPDYPSYQLMLMMVLVALCIGASHASTTYPLVGQVYNAPAMTAMIIACLMIGEQAFYVLAGLGLMFAIMMVVVGRDSDKRFLEVQTLRFALAQKKDDAENANIAKSKFLAAASHDLRQPLHALTLFSGLLKEKAPSGELGKISENIENAVDGLQTLLNSLLDISKLDAGTIAVDHQKFSLDTYMAGIEQEFRLQIEQKNLEFLVDKPKVWIESDPALLGRILRNLLTNSLRHTETGTIALRCTAKQDEVLIEVRDTGCGISQEHHTKIFQEFVQLHNPERDRSKGLGLGLAIVKRLTELLGHRLSLSSEPGAGCSVEIEIPRAPETQLSSTQNAKTQTLDTKHQIVWVIEDEPSILTATLALLESWNSKALGFASIQELKNYLAKTDKAWPDLVLADYRLQRGDTGLDVLQLIHQHAPAEFLAVIVTGDTAPSLLKDVNDLGYRVVHKPLKPEQLKSLLNESGRKNFDHSEA